MFKGSFDKAGERAYHTPPRRNPQTLPTLIRLTEILQGIKRKGDMYQPGISRVLVRGFRVVNECYPVVFVVIGDEGEIVVGVDDVAAKEVDIEAFHMVEAGGFEDYVGEFGGRDDFALGAVGRHFGRYLI